jgi:hypothetical protein
MPLRLLVEGSAFDPETIEIMSAAYEGVCITLGLADRTDPLGNWSQRKSSNSPSAAKVIRVAYTEKP